jgi:hypothetical protein
MEAACAIAGIRLYGYVTLTESAHVLHGIITELGGTIRARVIGPPLSPGDLAHPN